MSRRKQDSLLWAMAEAKCPKCHEGDMFQFPLRKITKFAQMHKHCPHCHLRFEREPGFFFGAMFISYIFSVILFVAVALLVFLFFDDPPTWVFMVSITVAVFLLLPFLFRYSRVVYLYGFGGVKYSPEQ